jgi:hypothetical protein
VESKIDAGDVVDMTVHAGTEATEETVGQGTPINGRVVLYVEKLHNVGQFQYWETIKSSSASTTTQPAVETKVTVDCTGSGTGPGTYKWYSDHYKDGDEVKPRIEGEPHACGDTGHPAQMVTG